MAEDTKTTQEIMQRWNTIAESENTGSAVIAETFAPGSGQDLAFMEFHLKLASAPTTIGQPVTFTFISKTGAGYNTLLDSTDLANAGEGGAGVTDLTIGYESGKLLRDGDSLKIDYANPDAVTWNLTFLGRKK